MSINHFKIVLAFIITTAMMCVVNFIGQIGLIFLGNISRLESTSALTIVLWIVTGVFGAIFTESSAQLLMDEKEITSRLVHSPVLIVSLVAIVLATFIMLQGEFMYDLSDFTLLFSNGFVFISYFFGAAGASYILRKL